MSVHMQILGHKPYEQSCYLSTMDLAKQILKQMHVQYEEEDDLDTYTRHLAVMVSSYYFGIIILTIIISSMIFF